MDIRKFKELKQIFGSAELIFWAEWNQLDHFLGEIFSVFIFALFYLFK